MLIVSKKNPEAFSTLQDAILSIDDVHEEEITIFIEEGIYEEKVFIRKNHLRIIGENPDTTIVRYGDGARKLQDNGTEYGTFNSATILFAGTDIVVENLTIENTAGPGHIAGQALAAYIASDRTAFYHCKFLGNQDTIYTGDLIEAPYKKLLFPDYFKNSIINTSYKVLRNYFKDCFIAGDVDYIFGSSIAYFEQCELYSKKNTESQTSYITACNTPIDQYFGYVFHQCSLTGNCEKNSTYLGRPWRDYAKTAFLCCSLGSHIKEEGWHNWDKIKAELTATYVEYNNIGEGADISKRVGYSKVLTNDEILQYLSPENVLSAEDGWKPFLV